MTISCSSRSGRWDVFFEPGVEHLGGGLPELRSMGPGLGSDAPRIEAVVAQLVRVADEPALDEFGVRLEMELEAEDVRRAEGLVRKAGCACEMRGALRDSELVPMPMQHGHAIEVTEGRRAPLRSEVQGRVTDLGRT
ncbi:hypothetical protein, partial [Burkholderia sp. SIMBA_024]|uniref:hypothetical protein n=1 Tax=Burkholderia sp. SIMBA_024 TaxID=3085768 RepID=UPI00397C3587